MKKVKNKTTQNNMINYGIVIAVICDRTGFEFYRQPVQTSHRTSGSHLCLYDCSGFPESCGRIFRRAESGTCRIYVCRCFFQCFIFPCNVRCDSPDSQIYLGNLGRCSCSSCIWSDSLVSRYFVSGETIWLS